VVYFTDVYHDVLKKCQEVEALLKQNSFQPSVPVGDSLRYYITVKCPRFRFLWATVCMNSKLKFGVHYN
jgi:hypothetical protein